MDKDPIWKGSNAYTDLVISTSDGGHNFSKIAVLPELFYTDCMLTVAEGLLFIKGFAKKSLLLNLEDG